MEQILMQSLFVNHPILEKVFMLLGGAAIIGHGVLSLYPRLLAFALDRALSNDHPVIRQSLIDNETDILNGIQAAKVLAQAKIDAAKAQAAPAATPAAQAPAS